MHQVVSTFVGQKKKATYKDEDTLQYQMIVSSQNMPYEVDQVGDGEEGQTHVPNRVWDPLGGGVRMLNT